MHDNHGYSLIHVNGYRHWNFIQFSHYFFKKKNILLLRQKQAAVWIQPMSPSLLFSDTDHHNCLVF